MMAASLLGVSVFLSACGDGAEESSRTGATELSADVVQEASRTAVLDCGVGQGAARHSYTPLPDAPGAPALSDALREVMTYSLPGHARAVPDEVPKASAARPTDQFSVTAEDDRRSTVELREAGRVVAVFSLSKTATGGWLVEGMEACNALLERSRP